MDYAAGGGTPASHVTLPGGSTFRRLRVSDLRIVFEEDATTIPVLTIKLRGGAYV